MVTGDHKRAARRTTKWTGDALLDFGEWLRVRSALRGLKGKTAARRTIRLSGKEKSSSKRKSHTKVAKPKLESSPGTLPDKLTADAQRFIKEAEVLKARRAEKAPKLKEIKKNISALREKINRIKVQLATQGLTGDTQESVRAQQSLASMEEELILLIRKENHHKDLISDLLRDIKLNQYEAKELLNSAEKLRQSQNKSSSKNSSKSIEPVKTTFFDLTLNDRELIDPVQWSNIENGRDTSLDELRVRAVVRAFSIQGDNSIEKDMDEARAILDPDQAFSAALNKMHRLHGSDFLDGFTEQEKGIIDKFKRLRATRRHFVANFINSVFDAPFDHYEAGVNWISEWLKEGAVSAPTAKVKRRDPAIPFRPKRDFAPSSSYTHNLGLWLKAVRERNHISVDEAVLLAETMEGGISKEESSGKDMSRSSWLRIESDLDGNPLRGKPVGRKKGRNKKWWLEAVVSAVSVDVSKVEFFTRYEQRKKVGRLSVEPEESRSKSKSLGKAVRLKTGEPLSPANKHQCLKPEIFEHNMQRAGVILDPWTALIDADKAVLSEPDKFHPRRFQRGSIHLLYLLLEYDERLIVNGLFNLPSTEKYFSLFHDDEFVLAFDVFPFLRNTRRGFLIEYLNLSLRLPEHDDGSQRSPAE